MKPRFGKLMSVWTTPRQLRKLADKLEAQMSEVKLGDDLPTVQYYGVDDAVLRIMIDQEEWEDEKRRPLPRQYIVMVKYIDHSVGIRGPFLGIKEASSFCREFQCPPGGSVTVHAIE